MKSSVATVSAILATAASALPQSGRLIAEITATTPSGQIKFDVPIGEVVHKQFSVTQLALTGAHTDAMDHPGADFSRIRCQRFKDAEATQPGSVVFSQNNPAYIATNPVEFGYVRCYGQA